MAITTAARAISLAYTVVSGQSPAPPAGPISSIQSWSFNKGVELAEFLAGNARVQSHYRGTESASITIETSDIARHVQFFVGQKLTDVILTVEAAKDSAGLTAGGSITFTLDEAVVTEVGELSAGNENSAPVVGSLTFTLSRHAGSSADPTITIAEAGA